MAPGNASTVMAVLALLATGGLVAIAGTVALWGLIRGRLRLARLAGFGAGGVALLYLALVGVTGVASRERVLPPDREKYFCELDCHLAYQVVAVHSLSAAPAGSGDRRWAVQLRTRFDETTISPRRGTARPVRPAPRRVALVDREGRRYRPVPGSDSLPGSTPLARELRPGESYVTTLVFELPAGVLPDRLQLVDDLFVSRWLIGQEGGLFHAPTLLQLPPPA